MHINPGRKIRTLLTYKMSLSLISAASVPIEKWKIQIRLRSFHTLRAVLVLLHFVQKPIVISKSDWIKVVFFFQTYACDMSVCRKIRQRTGLFLYFLCGCIIGTLLLGIVLAVILTLNFLPSHKTTTMVRSITSKKSI